MVSPATGRFLHTLLMLAALVASYWLYKQSQTKLALSDDHKRFLSLAALLGAFIGAKLPFLLEKDWIGLSPWIHWLSDGICSEILQHGSIGLIRTLNHEVGKNF